MISLGWLYDSVERERDALSAFASSAAFDSGSKSTRPHNPARNSVAQ